MKSDLVDVDVKIHHRTDHAYLVSTTGEKKDAVWVPKSLVEIEPTGSGHKLTLPEWLAIDKELV